MADSHPSAHIDEFFLRGKGGEEDGREDRLVRGPRYFGVIDGSTDRSGLNWGTDAERMTGGRFLAGTMQDIIESTTEGSIDSLLGEMNEAVQRRAGERKIDLANPLNRACASVSIYDSTTHTMYHLGDCRFAFEDASGELTPHIFDLKVDEFTTQLRIGAIRAAQDLGLSPFAGGRDVGAVAIQPYIDAQYELANAEAAVDEVWMGLPKKDFIYRVYDGLVTQMDATPVPEGTKRIILASDGYPKIHSTVKDTEALLMELVRKDPHCIVDLATMKGITSGNESFDDRAYLSVRLR